jgi:hypothetical protein
MVTVYQYIILDPGPVERRKSRRWGTRQAIDGLKLAEIVEDSATEVDDAVLNAGGFTALDFDPAG